MFFEERPELVIESDALTLKGYPMMSILSLVEEEGKWDIPLRVSEAEQLTDLINWLTVQRDRLS